MWNLNGNDIKSAKEQLESRRAKLKADYEDELKKIEAELADIETVERVAVNFVSSHKGDDTPSWMSAEPEKTEEKESSSSDIDKPADSSSDGEAKPATEQKGSRWRMRLGTVSETEAA
ncbi:MAG: hypothetical protein JO162_03045 [Alphaproteobacteria bacterium]|nr:hypothetical protein [Alphaproteobacteria bacterium]